MPALGLIYGGIDLLMGSSSRQGSLTVNGLDRTIPALSA